MTSTLGIVTLSPKHEEAFTLQLAKAASTFDLEVVRFSPLDLKPASNVIHGQKFTTGKGFEASEFQIPDLIYDRCLYQHDAQSKKAKPIMNWLKKYPKTVFLNTGISNKMRIFEQLRLLPSLQPYLPVCSLLTEPSDLLNFVRKGGYCKIQPLSQQHAAPSGFISLRDKSLITVQLNAKQIITFSHSAEVERWCKKYIGRSFLQFFNTNDQKDVLFNEIRILLIKNLQNQWNSMGIYTKPSVENSLLSNTQNSGHVVAFDHYLNSLKPHIKELLLDDIASIQSSLPAFIDKTFSPCIEFAVDLLHTNEGRLFISNVRSKPGRSSFLKAYPEKEKQLIQTILEHAKSMMAEEKEVPYEEKTLHHRSSFSK
ncbi:YheC/YheD family protein [Bacillus altitudinis]|uniref:YheC/YheD family protein n=1 Tax=Bacillus altitudinis TaxID=293387 RepID=UPI002481805B|nr:YheC/YheD family protein [Bacillus altitudinis]MDI6646542.1 YheC/YheD family protein [Bacillus altitudinis]MDI6661163.1 YheC/YheD family protein [Bacillus altitudinis]